MVWAVLLAAYLVSHFALSRVSRGMVERKWGITDAFIYLPLDPDVVADHERPLLHIHIALRYFYLPAWMLDQFLGGPWPMESMPLRSLGV